MYYNKVEICGVNTSTLKVLGDEEKKILLKKSKEGDEEARQELICGNLRLVLSTKKILFIVLVPLKCLESFCKKRDMIQ